MIKAGIVATQAMLVSAFMTAGVQAADATVLAKLENKQISCMGGNETAGRNYVFNVSGSSIQRIDQRFPGAAVTFTIGRASKGSLGENWSYETLSELDGDGRLHLYERVSLRSPSQNRHIYRTYEVFARGNAMYMVLYDGVNGARDWRMKTTRNCGTLNGEKLVGGGNKYWSTTFAR